VFIVVLTFIYYGLGGNTKKAVLNYNIETPFMIHRNFCALSSQLMKLLIPLKFSRYQIFLTLGWMLQHD